MRIMKFVKTILALSYIITTAKTTAVTPTSRKPLLKGSGRIIESFFSPSGNVIIYNNLGEVLEAVPTDYFSEYFLKFGPVYYLNLLNNRYSKTHRWTTAGKYQGKRIGHYVSYSRVAVTVELNDFEPIVIGIKSLTYPMGATKVEVFLIREGDPTRVLIHTGYQFYYYVHDFDTNTFFEQPYFGNAPLGSTEYDVNAILAIAVEQNPTGRYFFITNSDLYSFEGSTYQVHVRLDGVDTSILQNVFAIKYDKSSNFIFIKGQYVVWLYKWNPASPAFSFQKKFPELVRDNPNQFHYFDHPTDNDLLIFLNGDWDYLEIFHFDKTNLKMINTGKLINLGVASFNTHIQIMDPIKMILGFGSEESLVSASITTGKLQHVYHMKLSRGEAFPIGNNEVNLLINEYAIVEFDINRGLMVPKIFLPKKWGVEASKSWDMRFLLMRHNNDLYEMDTTKKTEDPLKVSRYLLRTKLAGPGYTIHYLRYSYWDDSIIYINSKVVGPQQYVFVISKHKYGEENPMEFSDNLTKTGSKYLSQIVTFWYKTQKLVLWDSKTSVSIFRDEPDGVKDVPTWRNVASCPAGQEVINSFAVNTFGGLFAITCQFPTKIYFYLLTDTSATPQTQLTFDSDGSTGAAEYSYLPGVAFIGGSSLARISMDLNNDLQIDYYPNSPDEASVTMVAIPMINSLPGKISVLKVRDDRSTEIINENPEIKVDCEDKFCAYCRNGKCLQCFSYQLKNFEQKCQRICLNIGQYYKKATNSCGSCHPSCKNCFGPGEKECIKCYKGFLREDKSCNEINCEEKQNEGEPLVTLEIQDQKENFKFCKTCGKYCSTCSLKDDCISCKEGYYMNEKEGCSKGGCKKGFVLTTTKFFCKKELMPIGNFENQIDSKSKNCFTMECKRCKVDGNICLDENIASERKNYEIVGEILRYVSVSIENSIQGMAVIISVFSAEASNFLIQATQNLGLIQNLRFVNVNFGELVDSFCRNVNNIGARDIYKKTGGKFYSYREEVKPNSSLYFKIFAFTSINSFLIVISLFFKKKYIRNAKFCNVIFVLKKVRFAVNMSCVLDFSLKIPRIMIYMREELIFKGNYLLVWMASFTSLVVYFLAKTWNYYEAEFGFFPAKVKILRKKKIVSKEAKIKSEVKITKEKDEKVDEEKTLWLINNSSCSVAKLVKSYIKSKNGLKFSKYFPLIEKARIVIFSCAISSLQQSPILSLLLLIYMENLVLWYLLGVQIFYRSFKWIILIEKTLFSFIIICILLYMVFMEYSTKISFGSQKRFIFMLMFPVLIQYIFLILKGMISFIHGIKSRKKGEKDEPFPAVFYIKEIKSENLECGIKRVGLNQPKNNLVNLTPLSVQMKFKKESLVFQNVSDKDNFLKKKFSLDEISEDPRRSDWLDFEDINKIKSNSKPRDKISNSKRRVEIMNKKIKEMEEIKEENEIEENIKMENFEDKKSDIISSQIKNEIREGKIRIK